MSVLSPLINRFVDWLERRELSRVDRFAREQAQLTISRRYLDGWCKPEECTRTDYHSPCHYQTALAAKRDRERKQ